MKLRIYPLLVLFWLNWPSYCIAEPLDNGLESWSVSLDLNNATALQISVDKLRDTRFDTGFPAQNPQAPFKGSPSRDWPPSKARLVPRQASSCPSTPCGTGVCNLCQSCCGTGCVPTNAVCCTTFYCDSGQTCCSNGDLPCCVAGATCGPSGCAWPT
jgi:hypothetical protein